MPSPALVQTAILFLIICIGYAAGKTGALDALTAKKLSRFLVEYILPALLISSMQRPFSAELSAQAFRMLGISLVIYALAFPMAWLVTRALGSRDPQRGVVMFACIFPNVAFMGIPVIDSVYGKDAIFQLSVFNIPFQFLAFSAGAWIIAKSGTGRLKVSLSTFLSPATVSTIIGFFFFLANIRLPDVIEKTLEVFGSMTTPLSLVIIGSVLSRMSPRYFMLDWRIHLASLYRLAGYPLIIWLLLRMAGLHDLELGIPVLAFGMPVAANTTILAETGGGDSQTASSLIFVSTLLSLVTIPLMVGLVT